MPTTSTQSKGGRHARRGSESPVGEGQVAARSTLGTLGRGAAGHTAAAPRPTIATFEMPAGERIEVKCRYGTVGDLLYVCESYAVVCTEADHGDCDEVPDEHVVEYRADNLAAKYPGGWDDADPEDAKAQPLRWKSGRFMPRKHARILLRVEDIRVQRLEQLTEEDAIAEGARHFPDIPTNNPKFFPPRWSMFDPKHTDECLHSARFAFGNAWNKIHRTAETWSHAWEVSPWVWALTFSVVDVAVPIPSRALPITFRPELVLKILAREPKTQTRRLLRRFDDDPSRATLVGVAHGVPRPTVEGVRP